MKVELHCHSNLGDGTASIKNIIGKADKELGAIAITDHNDSRSFRIAKQYAKNVIVIPGVEVSCVYGNHSGHVLILGNDINYKKPKTKPDVFDVLDIASKNNCITIDAHPFSGLIKTKKYLCEKEIAKNFDAIEVLNGRRLMKRNALAYELAKELKKPMTSGSDAHTLKEVGGFACEIEANDIDDILESIEKGRVKIPEKNTKALRIIASKMRIRLHKILRY